MEFEDDSGSLETFDFEIEFAKIFPKATKRAFKSIFGVRPEILNWLYINFDEL